MARQPWSAWTAPRSLGGAMNRSRLRPYLGPVIALLIVLALGAGTVYAAIPNGNGTYYACYVKNTGAVRLINYPKVKTCPAGQKLIKWSAKGPAGAAGPQGPQGPAGPADWNAIPNKPAGFADGVDNEGVTSVKLTKVIGEPWSVAPGAGGEAYAYCPPGSKLTGGGFNAWSPGFQVMTSVPGYQQYWAVYGINTTADHIDLYAYAICMKVEPEGALTVAKKGAVPASLKKAMKNRDR